MLKHVSSPTPCGVPGRNVHSSFRVTSPGEAAHRRGAGGGLLTDSDPAAKAVECWTTLRLQVRACVPEIL